MKKRSLSNVKYVHICSCSQKGDLDSHIASVHKEMKPFKCEFCRKSFSRKSTLNVHIASHSNVMIDAIDEFKKELDMINMSMPNHKIIHNVDNEPSNDIDELKNKLLNQLIKPVRWSNTMEYINKHNGIIIE